MDPDVVRRGYLKVSSSKGLLGSLRGGRKHWVVLKKEGTQLRSRIEVFKDEDDATRLPSKVIAINHISNVQTILEKKELTVVTEDESATFFCSSRADLDDWVRDIETLRHAAGGRGSLGRGNDVAGPPTDELYLVRLRQSASLLFHGSCILEVQPDFERNLYYITIMTEEDKRVITKWQIDHIRQYGSNEIAFKFQSGTKSPTGVDWFILDTEPGAAPRIHRAVDYWARHICEQATNVPASTSSIRGRSQSKNASNDPKHIPPRKAISPPPLPPTPSSSTSNGVYQPLLPGTKSPPPVYEPMIHATRDNRNSGINGTASSPPISSSFPPKPPGIYQSLTPSSVESQGNSVYQGLQEATRERSKSSVAPGGAHPPAKTTASSGGIYMGLNSATREDPSKTMYMGVNHHK